MIVNDLGVILLSRWSYKPFNASLSTKRQIRQMENEENGQNKNNNNNNKHVRVDIIIIK